ncbi:hypothetical protein COLO4_13281 [Corchorus olitorius]|uniref:Uncharacterized protein n=1 Tax=Corchorus olitorius TaxID=93759 RepID=A0A1R3JX54_9ROSI|nr:hypothetical protein COLO4_13281 [Corchorus olitorius]
MATKLYLQGSRANGPKPQNQLAFKLKEAESLLPFRKTGWILMPNIFQCLILVVPAITIRIRSDPFSRSSNID